MDSLIPNLRPRREGSRLGLRPFSQSGFPAQLINAVVSEITEHL